MLHIRRNSKNLTENSPLGTKSPIWKHLEIVRQGGGNTGNDSTATLFTSCVKNIQKLILNLLTIMSEICRLCLSEDQELHSIFHSDEIKPQALNLDDLISMCTSVVVSTFYLNFRDYFIKITGIKKR